MKHLTSFSKVTATQNAQYLVYAAWQFYKSVKLGPREESAKMRSLSLFSIILPMVFASGTAVAADLVQPPNEGSEPFVLSVLAEGWAGGSLMTSRTGFADIEDSDDSLFVYGGDLRAALFLSPGLYVQGDLNAEQTDNKKDDNFNKAYSYALHAAFRSQDFLFGGFIGEGKTWTEVDSDDMARFDFIGIEFQYFTDNSVFYLQAGQFDNSDDINYTHDGSFVKGEVQHYFGDSNKLTGQIAYASAESTDLSTDVVDWGLRFDKNFDALPVSVFASYSGLYARHDDGSFVDNVGRVGLQIQFGS